MTRVQFTVTAALHNDLIQAADKNNTSMSNLIRAYVIDGLKRDGFGKDKAADYKVKPGGQRRDAAGSVGSGEE